MFRTKSNAPVVLTVPDESVFSDRESRSDSMVPLFESLRKKKHDLSVIQLFSAGTSVGPAMKSCLMSTVECGMCKTLIFMGIEMSLDEMVDIASNIKERGGKCIWVSGGSDQYEVVEQGPPSNTSGNFKTVEPSKNYKVEQKLPTEVFFDSNAAKRHEDANSIQVNVVHNCPLHLAAKQINMIIGAPSVPDADCFQRSSLTVIHFVSMQDKIAAAECRFGDLLYSHGNIGTIKVENCNVLIGGLDSGDINHTFTNKWLQN